METPTDPLKKIVAFVDIGTNSVRLLVVRLNPNYSYTVISQEKEIVRLGEHEFIGHQNCLHPEAIKRAILVCKRFVELSKTYGASEFIAVATSAVRDAANKAKFLKQLNIEAGLKVRVISGKEEARLAWWGIASGVEIGDSRALFIDLGGGSTQLVIGTRTETEHIESLNLGAIRLTEMFLKERWAAPVPLDVYNRMKLCVEQVLPRASHKIRSLPVELAFGTSGTLTNLVEITNKMFKNSQKSDRFVLERKSLKEVADVLRSLSLEERRKVPGINPERGDIIVAGAAIVESIMDTFELKKMRVSSRGLRDGMLTHYLSRIQGFPEAQNISLRDRSVVELGRSCNFDERHSGAVADLALQLFDSAKHLGIHEYGEAKRELLRYAAMLHDIGDFISFNDHNIHSYYIISNAELLGFDQNETKMIANIVRFHRKRFPKEKALRNEGLDSQSQKLVIDLSTYLRIAENLDRSHSGLVKKVEFSEAHGKHMTISIWSDKDYHLEEWRLTETAEMLEKFLHVELTIKWIGQP